MAEKHVRFDRRKVNAWRLNKIMIGSSRLTSSSFPAGTFCRVIGNLCEKYNTTWVQLSAVFMTLGAAHYQNQRYFMGLVIHYKAPVNF